MDRRGSFDFNYRRSELFTVVPVGGNPRSFLTAPERYETVVGIRTYAKSELEAYPYGKLIIPLTAEAIAKNALLTLCDENKRPFIENVPALRFCNAHIRTQSAAAGLTPTAGPMVPVKILPMRVSLAACYASYLSGAKPSFVVELFYL